MTEFFDRSGETLRVPVRTAAILLPSSIALGLLVSWIFPSRGGGLFIPIIAIAALWGARSGLLALLLLAPAWFLLFRPTLSDAGVLLLHGILAPGVIVFLGRGRAGLNGMHAFLLHHARDLEGALNEEKAELERARAAETSAQTRLDRMRRLSTATRELHQSLPPEELARILARQAREGLGGKGRAIVYRMTPAGSVPIATDPPLGNDATVSSDLLDGRDYNPLVTQKRTVFIRDTAQEFRTLPLGTVPRNFASLIACPLIAGEEIIGVVRCESDIPNDLENDDLRYLTSLSVPAALILQNSELYARTLEEAQHDGLTGVFRRGVLDERLELELKRTLRYERPLSLIMIDIDHFKQLNDTHGHAAGDDVLRELGALLTKHFAPPAFVARYGGEEFTILMPNAGEGEAAEAAEAFRSVIEAHAFPGGIRKTISLGTAGCPAHGRTASRLIEAADAALYRAKNSGRNRVVTAGSENVLS